MSTDKESDPEKSSNDEQSEEADEEAFWEEQNKSDEGKNIGSAADQIDELAESLEKILDLEERYANKYNPTRALLSRLVLVCFVLLLTAVLVVIGFFVHKKMGGFDSFFIKDDPDDSKKQKE
jgi:hypothetical protein